MSSYLRFSDPVDAFNCAAGNAAVSGAITPASKLDHLAVSIAFTLGAGENPDFDFQVQTAVTGAAATEWVTLPSSQKSNLRDQDVVSFDVVDGILDQIRLRVVNNGNAALTNIIPTWYSDQQLEA